MMKFALEQLGRATRCRLSTPHSEKQLSDLQIPQLLVVNPSAIHGYKSRTRRIPKRAIELVQSYR
jgi:hypothetical protein